MRTIRILIVTLIFSAGCFQPDSPLPTLHSTSSKVVYSWETKLGATDGWQSGCYEWSYSQGDSFSGIAELELAPLLGSQPGWSVSWEFKPALNIEQDMDPVFLVPHKDKLWHSFHWVNNATQPPIPIPEVMAASAFYTDILTLLRVLTTSFFNQIVTHWPEYPIPVRLVPASNGPVNLTACLVEAVQKWNAGAVHPWFVLDSSAGWGIRLVHFPDREMHPPMAAQITRLDGEGRPLRINLLVGNNYQSPNAPPYVIRAFIHELGHALFLWGHSQDRIHCLWGLAPPMVSAPSADERKAARWWHGLPDGLDLSQYGITAP